MYSEEQMQEDAQNNKRTEGANDSQNGGNAIREATSDQNRAHSWDDLDREARIAIMKALPRGSNIHIG